MAILCKNCGHVMTNDIRAGRHAVFFPFDWLRTYLSNYWDKPEYDLYSVSLAPKDKIYKGVCYYILWKFSGLKLVELTKIIRHDDKLVRELIRQAMHTNHIEYLEKDLMFNHAAYSLDRPDFFKRVNGKKLV